MLLPASSMQMTTVNQAPPRSEDPHMAAEAEELAELADMDTGMTVDSTFRAQRTSVSNTNFLARPTIPLSNTRASTFPTTTTSLSKLVAMTFQSVLPLSPILPCMNICCPTSCWPATQFPLLSKNIPFPLSWVVGT
ncbi:hypothetical protein EMPG_13917 [Blastomyces silverae]|uniref:Uncharacterized protein n=1 Tax=Blastomyces silverae TaxID=2060906 RepID=A0A0H1BHX8_9EURO|nr:hypothetical protein EMPG_13917 [Blastomyces silverae]